MLTCRNDICWFIHVYSGSYCLKDTTTCSHSAAQSDKYFHFLCTAVSKLTVQTDWVLCRKSAAGMILPFRPTESRWQQPRTDWLPSTPPYMTCSLNTDGLRASVVPSGLSVSLLAPGHHWLLLPADSSSITAARAKDGIYLFLLTIINNGISYLCFIQTHSHRGFWTVTKLGLWFLL